jgi:hypothetical protein
MDEDEELAQSKVADVVKKTKPDEVYRDSTNSLFGKKHSLVLKT